MSSPQTQISMPPSSSRGPIFKVGPWIILWVRLLAERQEEGKKSINLMMIIWRKQAAWRNILIWNRIFCIREDACPLSLSLSISFLSLSLSLYPSPSLSLLSDLCSLYLFPLSLSFSPYPSVSSSTVLHISFCLSFFLSLSPLSVILLFTIHTHFDTLPSVSGIWTSLTWLCWFGFRLGAVFANDTPCPQKTCAV